MVAEPDFPPIRASCPLVRSGSAGAMFTFLFTDIEGSTRLLQRLGHGYDDVLADHYQLLRSAVSECGGTEVGTTGDAMFGMFTGPEEAVGCALLAQEALGGHEWPEGCEVRVRMGVHTGEARRLATGEYVGLALHEAARV